MVQERKKKCYKKWNLPLGHLDSGEDILAGAKREAEEETGLKLKIGGLVGIYHYKKKNNNTNMWIVFDASVVDGKINFPKNEIMDVKWMSFDEFNEFPNKKLRKNQLKDIVNDYKTKGSHSLNIINTYNF